MSRSSSSRPNAATWSSRGPRAIAYGEERRIRFSRPVCPEQVSASETLAILPGENDPALELLICDCPAKKALLATVPLKVGASLGRGTLGGRAAREMTERGRYRAWGIL